MRSWSSLAAALIAGSMRWANAASTSSRVQPWVLPAFCKRRVGVTVGRGVAAEMRREEAEMCKRVAASEFEGGRVVAMCGRFETLDEPFECGVGLPADERGTAPSPLGGSIRRLALRLRNFLSDDREVDKPHESREHDQREQARRRGQSVEERVKADRDR